MSHMYSKSSIGAQHTVFQECFHKCNDSLLNYHTPFTFHRVFSIYFLYLILRYLPAELFPLSLFRYFFLNKFLVDTCFFITFIVSFVEFLKFLWINMTMK